MLIQTKTKSTTEIAPIVCVEYDAASLEIANTIVPKSQLINELEELNNIINLYTFENLVPNTTIIPPIPPIKSEVVADGANGSAVIDTNQAKAPFNAKVTSTLPNIN